MARGCDGPETTGTTATFTHAAACQHADTPVDCVRHHHNSGDSMATTTIAIRIAAQITEVIFS